MALDQSSRARLKAPKSAAIAGVVFSVLLMISLVMVLTTVPATVTGSDTWLIVSGKTLLLALNLIPFAGVAFLWFIGVVRDRLGSREDRFMTTVFLSSGLLFLALLFVFAAVTGSIILLYTSQSTRALAPGYYAFGLIFAHDILNAYALKMAGVFMISTSTLFIRTQIIPRWMAYLGYGLAGLMLLRISHLDRLGWVALALPLWVLLISLYILIDNYRHVAETSTPANL